MLLAGSTKVTSSLPPARTTYTRLNASSTAIGPLLPIGSVAVTAAVRPSMIESDESVPQFTNTLLVFMFTAMYCGRLHTATVWVALVAPSMTVTLSLNSFAT